MIKKIYLILTIFSLSVFSGTELTFSLKNDSIWRGITQNDGEPTLSTDVKFSLNNGFYSGFWIENCCSENNSYPNREVGIFTGFNKQFDDNLEISISYLGTNYPNSKKDNFDELSIEFGFYNFFISYFIGLDNFPDYYELSYSLPFNNNNFYLSYGEFDSFKNDISSNGSNLSIGIESNFNDFDFDFIYFNFNSNGTSDLDDDGLIISISKKLVF
tara:strand:- start:1752 stop:2396 length:645 start_codon:yes stop_codon:yes gene_type:complete